MRFKSFLGELCRRHVFRVAGWYAVAAWLVIQIAVNVFPRLLLPDWTAGCGGSVQLSPKPAAAILMSVCIYFI